MVGTDQDITERKLAEVALADGEARFRTLFESAGDAIFLLEADTFIQCNRRTLAMFQCAQEQILGKSPYFFSPSLQPDGRQSREKALDKIEAALAGPQARWRHVH
jgi:PAS domain S-box-containing protein